MTGHLSYFTVGEKMIKLTQKPNKAFSACFRENKLKTEPAPLRKVPLLWSSLI